MDLWKLAVAFALGLALLNFGMAILSVVVWLVVAAVVAVKAVVMRGVRWAAQR